MFEKLELIQKRYNELSRLLARADVVSDPRRLQELNKEKSGLEDIVGIYQQYKAKGKELAELEALLDSHAESEMMALVKEEVSKLKQQQDDLLRRLKLSLIPKDPAKDRDVIVEIKGKGAFSRFKHERGVHRVQRVPITEASGRLHTSTATVAVLPEAEEIELKVNPDDLKMEFFHSRGAGGQNVNKVTTAVRITHLPTGIVASCQDERSQIRNRMKAMAVLRARLLDLEQRKQSESVDKERRMQVGSGQRAEKVRTYNFPQNRVTDHRINSSFHNLQQILDGELDEIIEALSSKEQVEQLEAALT
jgi:peptide chain release factor 1